ncbi:unnamed protein product [Prorocentrum cordatum]|uniref:Phosphoglycerate dehydrogenase n=1 Tax=Prorocentrum cordatum TaxID=2364126 RepID=A0ABN9WCH6_9DINO|nr:unnamed protein product [Polarella glacialis]
MARGVAASAAVPLALPRVAPAGLRLARGAVRRTASAAGEPTAGIVGPLLAGGGPLGCVLRRATARGRSGARRGAGGAAAATAATRVLLVDPLSSSLRQRLAVAGCAVEERAPAESVEEALARARPEVVIIRSSLLREEQLQGEGASGIQLVMRAGAGVDNIAVGALLRRGAVVANAAGANAVAVAELTMAHLLNLDRRLSDQVASLRQGQWRRLEFAPVARGLCGNILAVLGPGHIGREVVKRALAFGMDVRCWGRASGRSQAEKLGATWCDSPADAVRGAYAMTVHLPLSAETEGLVGKALFELLDPGGLVVNMSRGGVVDEAALLEAVRERGLRAGLDVFDLEPAADDREFRDGAIMSCKGIFGSHHTGARTAQAALAVEDAVLRAVEAHLSGAPVPGAVRPSAAEAVR